MHLRLVEKVIILNIQILKRTQAMLKNEIELKIGRLNITEKII